MKIMIFWIFLCEFSSCSTQMFAEIRCCQYEYMKNHRVILMRKYIAEWRCMFLECLNVYSDSDSEYQKNVFLALNNIFFWFSSFPWFYVCTVDCTDCLETIQLDLNWAMKIILSVSLSLSIDLCVMSFYCSGFGELVKVTILTLKRFYWSRNWIFSSILDHKVGAFFVSTWKLCNLFRNKEKSI